MKNKKHPSARGTSRGSFNSSEGEDFLRSGAVRQMRLQQLIQRELEGLLRDDVADPRLADVAVTAVDLTADCRAARVHVATPRAVSPAEVTAALDRAAPFLRRELASTLDLKFVPTLSFRAVTGVREGA